MLAMVLVTRSGSDTISSVALSPVRSTDVVWQLLRQLLKGDGNRVNTVLLSQAVRESATCEVPTRPLK